MGEVEGPVGELELGLSGRPGPEVGVSRQDLGVIRRGAGHGDAVRHRGGHGLGEQGHDRFREALSDSRAHEINQTKPRSSPVVAFTWKRTFFH